ncbi:MAG: mechanosensitive ion channel [Planctomycetota bacterium]|jgi:potassium efflux system protein|nr:mechanosensitive ion channel [Planctomycetota bacterium]
MADVTAAPETLPSSVEAGEPDLLAEIWSTMSWLWDYQLIEVSGAWLTPGKIVIAIGAIILGLLVASILSRHLVHMILRRLQITEGAAQVIQQILFYIMITVVFLIGVQIAGLPLTAFTVIGGALALGVGFGSQNLVNNFMSGLVLLVERPVRIGDLVEVDGAGGRVIHIGARSTTISNYSGVAHMIPNSTLLENRLTNWSLKDDLVLVTVTVGVAYGSDIQRLEMVLLGCANSNDEVVTQPVPEVLFQEFGDNALVFDLLVWIHARTGIQRQRAASALRFGIDAACREHGITIAFPQRDVHLDVTSAIPVRMVPPAQGDS